MSDIISVPASSSGVISPASTGAGAPRPVPYLGFSYRNTSTADRAVFRIRTGGSAGDILDSVSLEPGESAREDYGPGGLDAKDGLYFELVSGTVEGCVRHG